MEKTKPEPQKKPKKEIRIKVKIKEVQRKKIIVDDNPELLLKD